MRKPKKSILVTGIAGTGKTTISNKLNEMGYKSYNLDHLPERIFSMIHKHTKKPIVDHDNSDIEKVKIMDWVCSKEKLESIIENEPRQLAFYCGIATNMDEILPLFDKVIMLKIDEKIMRDRLTNRTDNDFGRTSEVQDWLMTWKGKWEKEMLGKGAVVVDANSELDKVVKEIINIAKSDQDQNNI